MTNIDDFQMTNILFKFDLFQLTNIDACTLSVIIREKPIADSLFFKSLRS